MNFRHIILFQSRNSWTEQFIFNKYIKIQMPLETDKSRSANIKGLRVYIKILSSVP